MDVIFGFKGVPLSRVESGAMGAETSEDEMADAEFAAK